MNVSDRINKLARDMRVLDRPLPNLLPDPQQRDGKRIETEQSRRLRLVEGVLGLEPSFQLGKRLRDVEAAVHNPLRGVSAKASLILFGGIYSVELLRMNPDKIFVFGDNNGRVGKGGQAIIRDEPNALGVSTKRSVDHFMCDTLADMGQVCQDLFQVEQLLDRGKRVVIHITPEKRVSLGCGLAQLPYRAPRVYHFIEHWFEEMKRKHKHATV